MKFSVRDSGGTQKVRGLFVLAYLVVENDNLTLTLDHDHNPDHNPDDNLQPTLTTDPDPDPDTHLTTDPDHNPDLYY